MLLCRCGRDSERARDLFVRGTPRDEHDDLALPRCQWQSVRRAEPAAILDERRQHATRIRVLAAHRAEDRAPDGFAWKVRIHVPERTHRNRMRCIALTRVRREDDGRHAVGELADQLPIRLVIRGDDREADIRVLDLRGRRDAPERNAEIERSQKVEDSTRTIDDKDTRGHAGTEDHTLYSLSHLWAKWPSPPLGNLAATRQLEVPKIW